MSEVAFTIAGAMTLARAGVRIEDRSFGGPQVRLVAAILLAGRDRHWGIEGLADQLWPDEPPDRWRPAVRGLVSRVRRLLADAGIEDEVVTNVAGRYVVDIPGLSVDIEVARSDVSRARAALGSGDVAGADRLAGRARGVLSRPVMGEVQSPWLEHVRRTVADDHFEALLLLGQARRSAGRFAAARSVLAEAIERAPLREDAWRHLMQVEFDAGNLAAALDVYEGCRHHLRDELGVDPSPATQALHTSILQAAPPAGITVPDALGELTDGEEPHGDAPRPEPDGDPYVGLRPFERSDAARFFGRDAATQELVELLERHRAVAVVGPSGSGKSSLVRAGLLPALATGAIVDADTWPIVVMTPGRQPVTALARALLDVTDGGKREEPADPDAVADLADRLGRRPETLADTLEDRLEAAGADARARVVLVIDQAEELFTIAAPDPAEAFLSALATAVRRADGRLRPVLTLRADFYDRAAANPDMAHLLSRSQLVVPPLTGDEVEAAVVGPVRRIGGGLELGVLGRLLDEAAGQPGVLPLLQHVLWESWQHREGDMLTAAAYERVGGLRGALARHAEETYTSLDDPALARRILLRGIATRPDRSTTRRPIHRSTLAGLADDADIDATLERLVAARLLQADRSDRSDGADGHPVHQLAHEALITQWPRLRDWVERQHAHLVTARRVGEAADRWNRSERDPDWLLTGRALDDAGDLLLAGQAGDADVMLAPVEEQLVQQSLAARARRRAERRVEQAFSRAELSMPTDPEASLLLALEVLEDVDAQVPARRGELHRLLHRSIHEHRLVRRYGDVGTLVGVAPDGTSFVTARPGDPGSSTSTLDVRTIDGEVVQSLPDHAGPSTPQVTFTPDGTQLVSGDGSGTIRVWNLATGTLERIVATGPGAVGGLDVAAGSGLVAAWFVIGRGRQLVVFAADGRVIHERAPVESGHGWPRAGRTIAFDPSGTHLLTSVVAGVHGLELVDTGSWETAVTVARSDDADDLEWHRDGTCVAVGLGSLVEVLDGVTLEQLRTMSHRGMGTLTWTPDGQRLMAGGGPTPTFLDRTTPEPDTPTSPPVVVRPTGLVSPDRLRAVPGTERVLIGGLGGGVQLHDVSVSGRAEVAKLASGDGTVRSLSRGLAWSSDGDRLAIGRGDGEIAITDADTWGEVDRWRAHRHDVEWPWPPVDGRVTWAPDGTFVVSTANDGTVTIHHLDTGDDVTVQVGEGSNYWWGSCAVTPDSRHVAVVFEPIAQVLRPDGTVVASRDLPTGAHIGTALLSPDGTTLAISHFAPEGAGDDVPDLLLWHWQSDEDPRGLDLGFDAFFFSWHPDGDRIAMAGRDQDVLVIDVADGTVVERLHGHEITTHDAAHHPDGRLLATSGWDRTVRVWNLEDGSEVAVFDGLTGPPGDLAFHPNRPWLAVLDWTGVVRVWTLDLDELVVIGRGRVTRDLRDDERRAIGDGPSG